VPDERMLDPSLMKSVCKSSAASVMDMEAETVAGGGAHVLSNGDCCLLDCRASSQVEEDLERQNSVVLKTIQEDEESTAIPVPSAENLQAQQQAMEALAQERSSARPSSKPNRRDD